VSGDDAYGRKVIVLSACRLPAREHIDHENFLMLVYNIFILLFRITPTEQAVPPVPTLFFVTWSVCLSSVSYTNGKGGFGVEPSAETHNCKLGLPPGE